MKIKEDKIRSIYFQLKDEGKHLFDDIEDPLLIAEITEFIRERHKKRIGSGAPVRQYIDTRKLMGKYTNHLAASGRKDNTVADYCRGAERLVSYLEKNKIRIPAISQESLENYLAARKKSGLGNNSYAKEVVLIRVFLSYMKEQKLISTDPLKIKGPSRVRVLREYLREADIDKILFYLDLRNETYRGQNLRDQVILYLGISCGLRTGEIIRLNWEDVDLENKMIKIISSKGGKSRILYFCDNFKKLLILYRKGFGFYRGAVVRGLQDRKRICATSLQNAVRKIYKGARVYRKGLNICSMRHTYCTAVNKKAGTAIASLNLGHSRMETTQEYLHFEKEDLKAAVIDMPPPLPSARR